MPTPRQLHAAPQTRKCFALLALAFLLTGASAANAQGNANGGNTNNGNANTGNVNANVNRNGNENTNTNANVNNNRNGNANNANANRNSNQGTGTIDPEEVTRWNEVSGSLWFRSFVTLAFVGVLGFFVYTIARAILRSRSTFRSPLGLPDGSLRAMLAFLLVTFLGLYVYAGVLSLSPSFKPPDFLIGVVATVVGFYFGSRANEERGGGAGAGARAGTVEGTVTDRSGTPVAKAKVELSQSGVVKDTEETDAKGSYRIDNVAPGEYEIQATAAGTEPSDRTKVTVKANAAQAVNLKLK